VNRPPVTIRPTMRCLSAFAHRGGPPRNPNDNLRVNQRGQIDPNGRLVQHLFPVRNITGPFRDNRAGEPARYIVTLSETAN